MMRGAFGNQRIATYCNVINLFAQPNTMCYIPIGYKNCEVSIMSDVFISYSREDKAFVSQLREAFLQKSKEVWIDWESIPASQSWWDEIKRGIATANNFVVVMSPNSMSSPICHLEIEYARSLGKRIIPVLHIKPNREACLIGITKRLANPDSSQDITRELWGNRQSHTIYDDNQKALAPINYFFFEPVDNFNDKFENLLDIIQTDFSHKEIHTRLGLRAGQWASRDRDVSFLLIGEELRDAENWMNEALADVKNPPVTDLQAEYIRASRQTEDKNTQHLHDMEAERQKLADDVQSERAKLTDTERVRTQLLTNIRRIIMISSIAIVILIIIALGAFGLRQSALYDLDIVNTQVVYAQATATQAAIIQYITNYFASNMLQNPENLDLQIEQMSQLLIRYPSQEHAYIARALIYINAGRYIEAILDFDEALRLNPNSSLIYYNRGVAYGYLGEYEQAIQEYDKALQLDPNDIYAYTNRGIAYGNLGDYKYAILNFNEALSLNSKLSEAYYSRGVAYFNLEKYEDAIADFDEVLRLNPNDAIAYSNRGAAYLNLEKYEDAIADFNEVLYLNPDDINIYFTRGNAYADLGKYEDAIADFDEMLRLNPNDERAYTNRGNAYVSLGKYEESLIDFNEALRLNPNDARFYINRGGVYQSLGNNNLAIADFDEALRLNPEFAEAYYGRGNAYYNLREYQQAIADFDQALRLNPEFAEAYYNRAIAYFDLAQLVGDTSNEGTLNSYKQNAVLDWRMAESLGSELPQELQYVITHIEESINTLTLTPKP